jgi:hypothetical protein
VTDPAPAAPPACCRCRSCAPLLLLRLLLLLRRRDARVPVCAVYKDVLQGAGTLEVILELLQDSTTLCDLQVLQVHPAPHKPHQCHGIWQLLSTR